MTMTNEKVACACPNCICTVDIASAIVVDGKYYCCEVCANGHKDGSKGCVCTPHNQCACG
jgi:hypothetical protein